MYSCFDNEVRNSGGVWLNRVQDDKSWTEERKGKAQGYEVECELLINSKLSSYLAAISHIT